MTIRKTSTGSERPSPVLAVANQRIHTLNGADPTPSGSFEARYGNLGFLADAIHLPVSTKITTRDIFFQGGNAALKADTGTGIVLYQFLQDPVQFADGGLGFRAWGLVRRT